MKKNGYLNKSNFLFIDKFEDIKGNGESYFLFFLDSY